MDNLPEILTAKHIASYLGISRRRVYELFQTLPKAGGIPNFSIGASKRVEKKDFIKWISDCKKR
ncbi:MAG: helix-turn-helix domain-containing protein [Bacillota bacterium]|nr:helix-turn-helix domain-containing protein [Bacillota bacterium]